jgi:hypothetical protein
VSKEKPNTMLALSSGPYQTTPEERLANMFDSYGGIIKPMEEKFHYHLPVDTAVKYYNAIGGDEKSYNLSPRLVKELQALEKYRVYRPLVVTMQKILDHMKRLYDYAENHIVIQNGTGARNTSCSR